MQAPACDEFAVFLTSRKVEISMPESAMRTER
jgi:hypothetical protein